MNLTGISDNVRALLKMRGFMRALILNLVAFYLCSKFIYTSTLNSPLTEMSALPLLSVLVALVIGVRQRSILALSIGPIFGVAITGLITLLAEHGI